MRSRARTHSHGRKPPLGVVGNVLCGERFQPFQKGWTDWWLPRSRIAHALLHSDERQILSPQKSAVASEGCGTDGRFVSSRDVHLCGSHEPHQLHLACALEQLDATRPCIVSTDDRARVATLALDNNTREALHQLLVPEVVARWRSERSKASTIASRFLCWRAGDRQRRRRLRRQTMIKAITTCGVGRGPRLLVQA